MGDLLESKYSFYKNFYMSFYNNKNAKILEIIFESKKIITFEISAFLSEYK
jgi:hypothetical protein